MKKLKIVEVNELCIFTDHPQGFVRELEALCKKHSLGEHGYILDCRTEVVT